MHSLAACFACWIVLAQVANAPPTPDVNRVPERLPAALRAAVEARLALETGHLRLRHTRVHADGVERLANIDAQFTPGETLSTNLGDDQGVVSWDTSGTPAETEARHLLYTSDHIWSKRVDRGIAELYPREGMVGVEYRGLGLFAGPAQCDLREYLWYDLFHPLKAAAFKESDAEGLHLVEAKTRDGCELRWWLDSQRGGSVVRAQYFRGGCLLGESHSELKLIDGVWFPSRVEYSEGDAGASKRQMYTVGSAEFNKSAQPRRITPEMIGVEPGETNIWTRDRLMQPGPHGIWDGSAFMTNEAYFALPFDERLAIRAGRREAARPMPTKRGLAAVPSAREATKIRPAIPPESEWEAYTRRFIADHNLDEGQTNAALAILKQCQERAGKYIQTKVDEFQQLAADVAENDRIAPVSPERDRKLARHRAELRAPIDEIFEKDLRPRLEKLLTPKQREAAKPADPRR